MLRIYLFGAPRVDRGGKTISINRRKTMALLAYLAVTGQPHSREALATLFWPENDQSSALANLRRDLSRLKRAVGAQALAIDRAQVSLNPEAELRLDVALFRERMEWVRQHDCSPSERCDEGLATLTEAAQLYSDDFMAGFSLPDCIEFDEWQFFQAEGLRQSLAEALQWLIRAHVTQREYQRAIPYARRWLALDPLHEPAQRELMQLYAWSGHWAAALRQYEECARLLDEELGVIPEPETTALYEAIKSRQLVPPEQALPPAVALDRASPERQVPEEQLAEGGNGTMYRDRDGVTDQPLQTIRAGRPVITPTGGRTPSAIPHNLPAQLTPLVGREEELAAIQGLVLDEPACRLLTLLGPGGTGKTRLALQMATQIVNEKLTDGDGLFFVRLQAVRSLDGLISAIADALDYVLRGQEPPQVQLLNFLSDKTLLLVLDNMEQLIGEGGATLVDDILQAAPAVKLLVTSREVLGLQGEWLYAIAGLPYPDGEDPGLPAEAFDAVRLFAERARQVRRDFSPTAELQAIVRICQLVEGMPLAIELAASWTKTLSCAAIAAEIERNLDFLETSLRGVPERHRSVRAVFAHSWERLGDAEREAFKRLAVFRGGFQRAAAEQVAGASLTALTALVDRSLLRLEPDGRYQIHELLRQYAEEQLQATLEEVVTMHSAHCAHYADFLHACLKDMEGGRQREAIAAIRVELENVRAAWVWAVELTKATEIGKAALPLSLFFQYQSRYLEGAQACEEAAQYLAQVPEAEQTDRVLAVVLVLQAWFYIRLGRLEQATTTAQHAQAVYRRLDSIPAPGFATDPLLALGIIASIRGDYAQAARMGEQAHQTSIAQNNRLNGQLAHYLLARAALALGQYESAQQHAQWAYAMTQAAGDRWFMAYCLIELGNVAWVLEDPAAAKKHFQASFALREEFGDPEGMAVALNSLGEIALRQEQYAEAERLGQQSLALYQGINDRGGLATSLNVLGSTAVAQRDYPTAQERFRQALEIATQMRFVPLALTLLGGIAEWLFATGQKERGVELLALIQSHPASEQETKDQAQKRLVAWETELAADQFAAATLRGQQADLESELDDLLATRAG